MPTRIVWLTFIAAMDEQGYCQFASSANVAHRARVTLEQADKAISYLEGPDPNSSDPDNEGRRLERVPGGWIVLNAIKYRGLVTKVVAQEQTRERVRRHRAKQGNAPVTACNAPSVTGVTCNDPVTPSEAEAEAEKIKSVSSEPLRDSEPSDPPVLEFPVVGTGPKVWILTQGQVSAWQGLYPGIDVLAEARKALAWCAANPSRRKTARGMAGFLVRWLNKSADAGPRRPDRPQPTTKGQRTIDGMREVLDAWDDAEREPESPADREVARVARGGASR